MGERTCGSSRLPAPPHRRYQDLGCGEDQDAHGDGSGPEDGEPEAGARMPADVAVALDELRAAAEAHDAEVKYSFLEAS
jgi:hypothetical protein